MSKPPRRRECFPPEAETQGWAFYVPIPLFAPMLDITRDSRVRTYEDPKTKKPFTITCATWTQGDPPNFRPEPGFVFYQNLHDSRQPWENLVDRTVLQITNADASGVTIRAIMVNRGVVTTERHMKMSRVDAINFLRKGRLSSAT